MKKNFKNAIALCLAVCVVMIAVLSVDIVTDVFHVDYRMWLCAVVGHILTIPLAIMALWLVECKRKAFIIGVACMLGCIEHAFFACVVAIILAYIAIYAFACGGGPVFFAIFACLLVMVGLAEWGITRGLYNFSSCIAEGEEKCFRKALRSLI
jgi:hypothetical protein